MNVQVWLDDQPAAVLDPYPLTPQPLGLRYLPEWRAVLRAYPLSPRLPLSGPAHPNTAAWQQDTHLYLEHLLPGGDAGVGLAAALGVGSQDTLALLEAAGDDLPGAVALRRAGGERSTHWLQQRVIEPGEMVERLQGPASDWLVNQPGAEALPWWPAERRWAQAASSDESIEVRPQLGIYLDQGQWWWTRTPQLASTHLLEAPPPSGPWAALPFNKLFCLRLAARLGLEVTAVELRQLPAPVLELQRIDRHRLEDGRVRRLHVVSAVQALGQASPSWSQLGELLALSPQPLVDRRALVRWWIFQTLVGHLNPSAQDLWFRLDHTGLRLAPAMNLWCPGALGAAGTSAGAVPTVPEGGLVPPAATVGDWVQVAKQCGIKPRSLAHELRRMGEAAVMEAKALIVALAEQVPSQVSQAILAVVSASSQRQLALVDDLLHTDHREL